MQAVLNEYLASLLMVYALGVKHGMDPDHLAVIDNLTRFNAGVRPHLSRWCGFLFSLGHGAVVTLVAGVLSVVATRSEVPHWLEDLGAWISILFLLALGVLNFYAVFRANPREVVRLVGLKGRWLGKLVTASHPFVIVCIGALFALSFDTISQTMLFSLTGYAMAGWTFPAVLGIAFTLGMMTTDGISGLWIGGLINRANRRAVIASRVMSLTVAATSLLIGGLGLARYLFPGMEDPLDGRKPLVGLVIVATVTLAFVAAVSLSRRQAGVALTRAPRTDS